MELAAPRRWLALGALALAMLTVGLDMTVLNIALPTLARDLHAGTAALQWFSTAYTLTLAGVMLPAGALGDRFGRKKFVFGALVLFGAASVWCAFASSSGELILARVLLGLAASVLMSLSMGMIPVLFPDPAERGRATTVWITAVTLGMPLGPIVGGLLLDHFWWGSVFLVNIPTVVIGALAVGLLVPETRSQTRRPIDLVSVVLSAAGLVGLTYGLIRFGDEGWGDGTAWATFVAGLVLIAGFVGWERTREHALADLGLFGDRGFRMGTFFQLTNAFAMFGLFFTIPLYFQSVLGVDSLGSGLRMLPMIGGLLVASNFLEGLRDKIGLKLTLMLGFGALAAGMAWGAFTDLDTSYGVVAAWMVVVGLGIGLVLPTSMALAVGALTPERAGAGSALLSALRQAAGTTGVAVLGTVLSTRYHSELGSLDREPISDGVGSGVAVAGALGDQSMLHQVRTAFLSGMDLLLAVCAGIAVAGLVLSAVAVRNRAAESAGELPEPESAPVA
ncbi:MULTISPECIES: DHA2 family efflux MFS transporter permease subunit [Streptomyces]|uniref:MFS transporter n=2 Tax=Streptomyces TaxID=1883 RepID=A0A2U9P6D7_STRAS|nr:DHA2 family efflux MFS transporter permease subunit [Streptomyces actuosus]AWT45092.1 MFS transporter [Streptomyces actuosus]MBM4821666.1 DHA2 family efflux MFS transporter permease subunit [Streptomyces actuosus]